jgi:hypothetical protein
VICGYFTANVVPWGAGFQAVNVGPNQLEQLLINLAVNARGERSRLPLSKVNVSPLTLGSITDSCSLRGSQKCTVPVSSPRSCVTWSAIPEISIETYQ